MSCEITPKWMSLDLTEDESLLVQVMAWCHQATGHNWANVDTVLCHHMASLGPNELTRWFEVTWLKDTGSSASNGHQDDIPYYNTGAKYLQCDHI